MPTWTGFRDEDGDGTDGVDGLDDDEVGMLDLSLEDVDGVDLTTPEKRHGSCGDGVSPMSLSMAVIMLYQWCGDLRRPYKVFFRNQYSSLA